MERGKFIELGAAFSALAGSGWLSACTSGNRNNASEEIKSKATAAFNRFEEVWNFNDFWKRGNTFDACLVFVNALASRWPEDPEVLRIKTRVKSMLEENLLFFKRFDPGSLWADDFGWWGLMAINARKFLLNMNERDLAESYYRLSTDLCWEYKRKTAYDSTPDAQPVPHGCRNGDANGDSRGVKNTVTNVLLFLLSSRIYRMNKEERRDNNEKYLELACRQWLWFDQWFELGQYQYLKKIGDDAALVQERPMAFFEGSDYTEKIHPPWAEGWVWSGDQGMLVAALADMFAIKDDAATWLSSNNTDRDFNAQAFESKLKNYIRLITNGVKEALVFPKDQIFREAPCYSSFGPVHGNDYLAGRGIMLRYLGQPDIAALLNVDLSENIKATANAIWETRDPQNNQFRPEFTSPENDREYIQYFRSKWELADDVTQWDIEKMATQNRYGVCQSIGLDMFGALIRNLKKS